MGPRGTGGEWQEREEREKHTAGPGVREVGVGTAAGLGPLRWMQGEGVQG